MTENGCPLARRLAAIFYDTILVFCVIFVAWQPVPLVDEYLPMFLSKLIRLTYLFAICFLYFSWSWCRGGQTLGMKAWKIKLVAEDGPVSRKAAFIRFVSALISWAPLGLGFVTSLFHQQNLAWHDVASQTRLIRLKAAKH